MRVLILFNFIELINCGGFVNITDSEGWTPLHVAAYFQRTLVCHILLKMGADINIKNRDN